MNLKTVGSQKTVLGKKTKAASTGLILAIIAILSPFIIAPKIIERSPLTTPPPGLKHDIYYFWKTGRDILEKNNPYSKVLEEKFSGSTKKGDIRLPVYLPGYYLLSAASQAMGLSDYDSWIYVWHKLCIISWLLTGLLLFLYGSLNNKLILSLAATTFWLFNRWSLYGISVATLDFLPIFLLILSIILLNRKPWSSLLLYSASLSLKHFGIILLPLYIINVWHHRNRSEKTITSLKKISLKTLAILPIPIIISLPFIIGSARGFIQSLMLVTIYGPFTHGYPPSLDTILNNVDIFPRTWLILIMALIYLSFLLRQTSFMAASLLVFAVFAGFNTTLFHQYILWLLALVALMPLITAPNPNQAQQRPVISTKKKY
jgi:hypothetical protein